MLRQKSFTLISGLLILLSGCSRLQQNQPEPLPLQAPSLPMASQSLPLKIGVLLPLSGTHSTLGKALQKAAVWAYYKSLKNQNVSLIFENAGSTEAEVKPAVQNLINQQVQAVIGPVFASQAKAVQSLIASQNIPVFSLSNNPTSAGGRVFIMGSNPSDSMTEGLSYAAKQGIKTVIALLPQSAYGYQLRQALPQVASELGLVVQKIHMYSSRNPYDYDISWFEGVDGIFLPEGAPQGAKIIAALFHQGVDLSKLRMIGSSLWEDMSALPEGAWFAAPDLDKAENFSKEYESLYGMLPPKIAVILLDTLSLIASLKENDPADPFSLAKILHSNGFTGLGGPFRFNKNQYVERPLNIYEVVQGRPHKVKSAELFS